MISVFYCHACGARFEVDARMAGKRGRCKKCGEQMVVPASAPASAVAKAPRPRMATAGVAVGGGSASSWVGQLQVDEVSLAPLTIDRAAGGPPKPSMFPEDDLADSNPYLLAEPERRTRGKAVSQVNQAQIWWRRQLGMVERFFRWINQSAYLVSVPFLMILLLGTMIRSHSIALLGAAVVVLLNITRLISGAFNLAVIPFRDGISWKRLKKPVRRLLEPAITIGLVALAFVFIPWLSKGGTSKEILNGHFRAGLRKFEQKIDDVQAKASALEAGPTNK